jgi:dihydroorotate dehydrogenase
LPNLQPVDCRPLAGGERDLPAIDLMRGSWAVSFGMPSKAPDVWRADVERTRERLPREKILSVSVVGTMRDGWTIDELADDYARCARWAVESGADCVEANFSCPNVSTCDGQLYQHPRDAAIVAERVRSAIGAKPFLIKIGRLRDRDEAAALIEAVAPLADALAMTNSIAATVVGPDGRRLFDGQLRGICGAAIRDASIAQVRMAREIIAQSGRSLQIVGVGGAATADDVRAYLDAGAHAVHLATAAMVDPEVGIEIRRQLSQTSSIEQSASLAVRDRP